MIWSYLLISLGGIWGFMHHNQYKLKVSRVGLIVLVAFLLVGTLSTQGLFIGPVGDSQRYHQTINSCFMNFNLCGSKLHENIWGSLSIFLGPLWGGVYGYITVLCLQRLVLTSKSQGAFVLFSLYYSAYQLGNGMSEATYFLLGFFGLYALFRNKRFISLSYFVLLTVGHIGNAASFFALWKKKWGVWATVILAVMAANSLFLLAQYINKAGALMDMSLVYAALDAKLHKSIQEATTSYAGVLLENNFPRTLESILLSILFYIFPIFSGFGASVGAVLVSLVGSLYSLGMFVIAGTNRLMWVMLITSIVIFSLGSYTPGVALRHKVPIFLLMCTYQMLLSDTRLYSKN